MNVIFILMDDKYTLNVCENFMGNIFDSVWEMSTEILDQFPIYSSFNGIVLSWFVCRNISSNAMRKYSKKKH